MHVPEEPVILDDPNLQYLWRTRVCKREGYYKSYYLDTSEGDRIELDYNHSRNMVHISLRLDRENGREYTAIIKSGTIIRERDVHSARPVDLHTRLYPLRKYFGLLREELILRTIGGIYSIPEKPYIFPGRGIKRDYGDLQYRDPGILERILRYLRKKRAVEMRKRTFWASLVRRIPAELLDVGIGVGFTLIFALHWIRLTDLSLLLGFAGIYAGAIDWVWRQRDPFLPKVMLLLGGSAYAAHMEWQYRLWSIFL